MKNKLEEIVKKHLKEKFPDKKFVPGETFIPVSGKTFDVQEMLLGIEAVLDGWWTEGRFAQEFEKKLSNFLGAPYVSLTNSGSSANLLALFALTSSALGNKRLKRGDEVITVAASFPTTVNPIILANCTPVFVDVNLETKNVLLSGIKKAINKKTKAIIIAHTLGNPFSIDEILKVAKENDLWVIEDCCDALGSKYKGKPVGTFGDISTFSFYPAHQITMGEGGAVVTKSPLLHRAVRQFRDWGRDCWCGTGKDNTCGKRFCWKLGKLPFGYDHKYIYSQIGFNLKITDMQAAIGLAQIDKLPSFIEKRKENFNKLYKLFQNKKKYFIIQEWEKEADPCWFGFMLIIKDGVPFTRLDLINFLESKKIATRTLFAGNLLKHPAYENTKYRVIGELHNTNKIMNDGFWIGVYPGITGDMIDYIYETFNEFIKSY